MLWIYSNWIIQRQTGEAGIFDVSPALAMHSKAQRHIFTVSSEALYARGSGQGKMSVQCCSNAGFRYVFLSPEINCFFSEIGNNPMRALGREKHMFFFGYALPKFNARTHLKQRKKHSGLIFY